MLVFVLLLVGCGRALAPPEEELAEAFFGPTLDVSQVRVVQNPLVGAVSRRYPARPRTTCRERLTPPDDRPFVTGRAGGIVFWNHIHIRPDLMRADFTRNADGSLPLGAAMFLLHELTHVWQWQNREVTGYSPWRGGAEHVSAADPYLFDPESRTAFLDYGYEQQASLVEEYLCCRALDPQGARTRRLEALLSPVMPLQALPLPTGITLPWPDMPQRGICA